MTLEGKGIPQRLSELSVEVEELQERENRLQSYYESLVIQKSQFMPTSSGRDAMIVEEV